jgi:hypothetical protein
MAKIKIDGGMLTMALETYGEMSWYLDVETGEFIPFSEYGDNPEDIDPDDFDNNPQRYRYIEPIDSHDGFHIMQDFVETLPDSEAKRTLTKSLTRPKPFRNFKDDLYDFPQVQDQWYKYHEKNLLEIAKDWLKEQKIDAELTTIKPEPES